MRLLISGSRNYTDEAFIEKQIDWAIAGKKDVVIIHGGCPRGVDAAVDAIAKRRGWVVDVYPADWSLGCRAGPMRNAEMMTAGKPDYAIFFLSPPGKGTADCLANARRRKVPFSLYCVVDRSA